MSYRSRLPLLLSLVTTATFLALLAACAEGTSNATPVPQRIVFVAPDRTVFTIDEDGSNRQILLGGAQATTVSLSSVPFPQAGQAPRYFWPTWSPTGEQVAVSRIPGTIDGSQSALVLVSSYTDVPRTVQDTPPGVAGLVAADAPHYVQWSPDGQHLTFIAPTAFEGNLAMFLASIDDLSDPQRLTTTAPLYHSWASDSSMVLIHRQEELLRYAPSTKSLVDLGHRSLRYRTPAVSPSGAWYAFVTEEGGEANLVAWSVAREEAMPLLPVERTATFLWSPTSDLLAAALLSA